MWDTKLTAGVFSLSPRDPDRVTHPGDNSSDNVPWWLMPLTWPFPLDFHSATGFPPPSSSVLRSTCAFDIAVETREAKYQCGVLLATPLMLFHESKVECMHNDSQFLLISPSCLTAQTMPPMSLISTLCSPACLFVCARTRTRWIRPLFINTY